MICVQYLKMPWKVIKLKENKRLLKTTRRNRNWNANFFLLLWWRHLVGCCGTYSRAEKKKKRSNVRHWTYDDAVRLRPTTARLTHSLTSDSKPPMISKSLSKCHKHLKDGVPKNVLGNNVTPIATRWEWLQSKAECQDYIWCTDH